jgi:hypothetical protein
MGTPSSTDANAIRPTALWAVQVMSFLCSIGTGLVMNGVFYLTETAYGFDRVDNLLLALIMGATYIVGAKFAGPGVRIIRRAIPGASSRSILMGLMVAMALPLLLPLIVPTGSARNQWVVWLMVLLYSPLTGVLWPMMESFLSGGRTGSVLRSAISMWNLIWSGALLVPFLASAALIKGDPAAGFVGLAGIHVFCAFLLATFQREPAPHLEEAHEPHPPVYTQLLVVFRMLLPMGYFVFSAMNPILPSLMASMGVAATWRPVVAMSWLASRTAMFAVLGKWQAWHGKWGFPIVGAIALLGGFAVIVLSPLLGQGEAPVAMMVGGLLVFGVGMAIIYAGAIYYAMEVGKAEVDAGGTHEALIGVGYMGGPACGLAVCEVIRQGIVAESWFEVLVLGVVGAIGLAVGVYAVAHARSKAKSEANGER